ncbi:hypothetical protein SAMN05216371_0341 [Streptomyces sp. TLI_053]|uniref:hypothetical protein n=1 Tax=Streptomyces sp. TLI_053 TaxID=1855352 RepID=UPI000879DFA8|nr:hypothetical protein [Streptomyces sp. TLI_053]SDS64878.1 hypothetical protein SAMN05216371_0341 [Streptomyces sp. TLI_053]
MRQRPAADQRGVAGPATDRGRSEEPHRRRHVARLVLVLATYDTGIGAGPAVLAGSWADAVDLLLDTLVKAVFDRLGPVPLTASRT